MAVFSEAIAKTSHSRLHEKHRIQITKIFETRNDGCQMKIFKTYLVKRTAHSARKTLAKRLKQNNVAKSKTMSL